MTDPTTPLAAARSIADRVRMEPLIYGAEAGITLQPSTAAYLRDYRDRVIRVVEDGERRAAPVDAGREGPLDVERLARALHEHDDDLAAILDDDSLLCDHDGWEDGAGERTPECVAKARKLAEKYDRADGGCSCDRVVYHETNCPAGYLALRADPSARSQPSDRPPHDALGRERLAEAIREARTAAGLTLRALADRTGVDFTYLSKVEHGDRPGDDLVAAIDRETGAGGRLIAIRAAEPCPRCGAARSQPSDRPPHDALGRERLAEALLRTEWWLHCHSQTAHEWTSGELADAILAALRALGEAAQAGLTRLANDVEDYADTDRRVAPSRLRSWAAALRAIGAAREGRDSDRDGGLDRLQAAVEAAFETVHGNGDLVYGEVEGEYGLTRESLLAFIEAARLSPDTRQEDGTDG